MARLLLIEDDDMSRKALERLLRRDGHEVVVARQGREGMSLFRLHAPDLVVTDIVMPEQEGIETIMELRAAAPECPIIAISGGGRIGKVDFLDLALRVGAAEVIAKPFDGAQLRAAVARCLAGAP